jgi:glycosyltransferase involved in cell wall biosynthesis
MEVPVVATRVAGVPSLIADGVNGVLANGTQPDELAESLGKILRDQSLRDRTRRAARQTIEERCSFAQRMDRIRRTYDEIIDAAT